MNDFTEDDVWQRERRDAIIVPYFYERVFPGRYRLVDDDKELQSEGIDTIIQRAGGEQTVDEKIVRWAKRRYTAFCLETKSCTVEGHEKPGWMFYGKADRLLYCFELKGGHLDCYWLDMPALQRWFWPQENRWPEFHMATKNKTTGRVVPIKEVCRNVKWKNFQLSNLRIAA